MGQYWMRVHHKSMHFALLAHRCFCTTTGFSLFAKAALKTLSEKISKLIRAAYLSRYGEHLPEQPKAGE
jgi:hypothetical protein